MRLNIVLVPLLAALLIGPAAADDAAKRAALVAAYPGAFTFESNELVFADGTRLVWDDGVARSPAELITAPDVEDMFTYRYPLATAGALVPAADFDPGRVRSEPFFKALYGTSERAVRADVIALDWFDGSRMTVTTRFDIDDRLAAVRADLAALGPDFAKYLAPPGGGFNWRVIANTTQLSVHSFGAAVDINTEYTDYWVWAGAGGAYRNRIPLEIVAAFEDHGFIWGGRWAHFDTMHFEYRPELLIYARGR